MFQFLLPRAQKDAEKEARKKARATKRQAKQAAGAVGALGTLGAVGTSEAKRRRYVDCGQPTAARPERRVRAAGT